jgi:hypothetical protein
MEISKCMKRDRRPEKAAGSGAKKRFRFFASRSSGSVGFASFASPPDQGVGRLRAMTTIAPHGVAFNR